MIQAKCIQKFRDKSGKIIGYKLQDNNGQIKELSATDVKNAIKQGKINIVNLQLTTDNRLIDKNTNSTRDKEENNKRSSLACISENLVSASALFPVSAKKQCTKAPKQELASASSIVNSSNNYIIQQIDAANGILIMNNKSLNRDLIVNKAINNKIGILGLSAGSTIETSFVTNDYLANYNRLQNIFYVLHKELWKSCIDSKLTEKVLNYSKSLIGLRNNKLCYFCDFLELYIGEPIFLVIEPIEIGNNSYVFDCEYTCNEFTVHKRLNSVQNIVDIYRKLYNKYKEI